jgi:glycosyltransferase involved in cell wall biosynthesis
MRNPRILIISDFFLPGYKSGGGMRTVVNTLEELQDEFEFLVVSRDHDGFGDRTPYKGIAYGTWNRTGPASVRYLKPNEISPWTLVKIIKEVAPDAVYLNSIFSTPSIFFFLARLFGLIGPFAVGVAPCGELSDGAMSKGTFKKSLFLALSRMLRMHRGVLWRASDTSEKSEITLRMKAPSIDTVPDLAVPLRGHPVRENPKRPGILKLVFFSRIVPKKNLEFLIGLLREVDGHVSLDLIGPIEDSEYESKLRKLIRNLPAGKSVRFLGPIPYDSLIDHVGKADLFVLPSLGENFGHVIAEAFSASCPVMVSNRTPWRDLEAEEAGVVLPLESKVLWIDQLNRMVAMGEDEHARLRAGASKLASTKFSDETARRLSREYFRRLADALRGPRVSK